MPEATNSLVGFRRAASGFLEGTDTPRKFLERCLETIEARDGVVKAFVTLNLDGAREAADAATRRYAAGNPLSPVDGCPVAVKDIIETRDMPTQMNSEAFKGHHTYRDAACVESLRHGGAVILGKTVTTEFAVDRSGPTTNPYDPTRTPGGSSSGSAAAVGAGMVPLAFGTQTNGSHIRPASYCGAYGFKGSLGLIPTGGVHPLADTLDHVGLFGGSLDDVWAAASWIAVTSGSRTDVLVDEVEQAAPPAKKPTRLLRLHLQSWEELDPASRGIFNETLERIGSLGIEIVDRDTSESVRQLEDYINSNVQGVKEILAYEMRWPFRGYISQYGDRIGPRIHSLIEQAASMSTAYYRDLLARRAHARNLVRDVLRACGGDAFVMPASCGPAPKGLAFTGSREYVIQWSWLGYPSMTLPLMQVDGLPFGVQLMSVYGEDRNLVSTACYLDENKNLIRL